MDRTVRDVVRRGMSLAHRSTQGNVSASKIRKSFLDFFCETHDHLHIFSSPVFSVKDPTLAFVNAGMNQFKDVFLGLVKPEFTRVANWQKCIRVGGKHNDLSEVGLDGTHHTFFEMLGNWSFGDYFKPEACRMSWELLTKVYGIPPERLYVTYFQGDKALGLDPDEEVRDIWREIGVKDSHILPFSAKDNFWEGSLTGPCGPCSEIHYDHCPGRTDAGALVNTGDPTLTELWNLVFIQYNRLSGGTLQKLPQHFVDTGMGFERLVAVLQEKTSNYDTDLFQPLFQAIQKYSGHSGYTGKYDGNPHDNAYRILADHSRMLTVALSDGMIPSHEYKLRKVLRRAYGISEEIFGNKPGMLKELSCYVAETLSDGYPQIGNNLQKIHFILEKEEENMKQKASSRAENWKKLKDKYPELRNINVTDLVDINNAYRYIEHKVLSENKTKISGEDAWILFDTYGIPENVVERFAKALGLQFSKNEYEEYKMSVTKEERKRQHDKFQEGREKGISSNALSQLEKMNLDPTVDYFKYDYRVDSSGKYIFNKQPATINAIVYKGEVLNEITPQNVEEGQEVGLVLDRTQLFSEEGNQCSDTGTFLIEDEIVFDISRVEKVKGLAIHFGSFRDVSSTSKVTINCIGVVELDEERRLKIMRNHTALHLLNSAVRNMTVVSGEKFSKVSPECVEFHTKIYKDKFSPKDSEKVENYIKEFILHGVSVKRKLLTRSEFQKSNDIVFIPGESILSLEIPVIEINSGFKLTKKHCTGTHVLNTADLKELVITDYKDHNKIRKIIAMTGEDAIKVREADDAVKEEWQVLQEKISKASNSEVDRLPVELESFNEKVNNTTLSAALKNHLLFSLANTKRELEKNKVYNKRKNVEREIRKAIDDADQDFAIYSMQDSSCESIRDFKDFETPKPLMVFIRNENLVKIFCAVPQDFVSKNFSAKTWLLEAMIVFNGIGFFDKSKSSNLWYSVKEIELTEEQVVLASRLAKEYAEKYCRVPKKKSKKLVL